MKTQETRAMNLKKSASYQMFVNVLNSKPVSLHESGLIIDSFQKQINAKETMYPNGRLKHSASQNRYDEVLTTAQNTEPQQNVMYTDPDITSKNIFKSNRRVRNKMHQQNFLHSTKKTIQLGGGFSASRINSSNQLNYKGNLVQINYNSKRPKIPFKCEKTQKSYKGIHVKLLELKNRPQTANYKLKSPKREMHRSKASNFDLSNFVYDLFSAGGDDLKLKLQ